MAASRHPGTGTSNRAPEKPYKGVRDAENTIPSSHITDNCLLEVEVKPSIYKPEEAELLFHISQYWRTKFFS